MTVKQRLIEFAKSQERSVRAFEIKCGLTIGYINAIRVSIQPDKIESIASHYPNLNTEWLLTGNGNMLKTTDNMRITDINNESMTVSDLVKAINNLSEAAIMNAKAAVINDESNKQTSNNVERMLDMLNNKTDKQKKKTSTVEVMKNNVAKNA